MKRIVALGFVAGFLMVMLTGCDPKGQACSHKGDVKSSSKGWSRTCTAGPDGNTWQ